MFSIISCPCKHWDFCVFLIWKTCLPFRFSDTLYIKDMIVVISVKMVSSDFFELKFFFKKKKSPL